MRARANPSAVPVQSGASLVDTLCGEGRAKPQNRAGPDDGVACGSSVGRYLVLERVGAGGMGVVYAAYDPDLDRRVALKVLRGDFQCAGSASSGRARLLREAQAIATVHHENVIAVHDVGTFGDRVFIAMEFIEGDTVGAWQRTRRTPQEVLHVFSQAGRGLAAAHAQGLVHRDFKPDNVLLERAVIEGGPGRVCVVDFGLARRNEPSAAPVREEVTNPGDAGTTVPDGRLHTALARPRLERMTAKDGRGGASSSRRNTVELSDPGGRASELTRTGAVVGTPAYMAPEQHLGAPATEKSDQFSFCVSLYEALYGERPFAGDTHAELVGNLTDGTMRSASPAAGVPGWLRRVLLRGLSLEPAGRFPSMDALLCALQRDRTRRRRAWRLFGVAGVGASLAALAFATATDPRAMCAQADEHLRGVWDDEARARYSEAFLATGLPFARDAWTGASRLVDDYAARWVAERVGACEATHLRGEQSAALLDERMACLDEQLDGVRAVTSLFATADAPVVEGAVDAVHRLVAPERCSGRGPRSVPGAEPIDAQTQQALSQHRRALQEADALIDARRLVPAQQRIDGALAAAEALHSGPLRAQALIARAEAQEAADDLDGARSSLREGLLAAEAAGEDTLVASAWIDLVWIDGYRCSRFSAANDAADHADAVLRRLGDDQPSRALLVGRVGDLRYAEGEYEGALSEYTRALALHERLDGPEHPRAADAHTGIGNALLELGRYAEGLSHYETALTILEQTYGGRHPYLAHALTNIGNTQEYLEDLLAARETHERAVRVAEDAYGPDHTTLGDTLNNYGTLLLTMGDLPFAAIVFERAHQIWERAYGPDHPDVAIAVFNLGLVAEQEGDVPRATTLHREALRVRLALLQDTHPYVADSREHLQALLVE